MREVTCGSVWLTVGTYFDSSWHSMSLWGSVVCTPTPASTRSPAPGTRLVGASHTLVESKGLLTATAWTQASAQLCSSPGAEHRAEPAPRPPHTCVISDQGLGQKDTACGHAHHTATSRPRAYPEQRPSPSNTSAVPHPDAPRAVGAARPSESDRTPLPPSCPSKRRTSRSLSELPAAHQPRGPVLLSEQGLHKGRLPW